MNTMKQYVGTKRLSAQPMTRGEYNAYRGWLMPENENPADRGYLVEYHDGGKANDSRHAGYISWSPADVFERHYREEQSDFSVEQEIQAKGKTAARVTPADVEAAIDTEHYFTAADGVLGSLPGIDGSRLHADTAGTPLSLLTFCVLVLRNGFTVTGESACASPENFDAEIGRKVARANAVNKVWPLMGYALRSQLAGV